MTSLLIEELSYCSDSALLFDRLRDLDQPVFLDSSAPYCQRGRFDLISAEPRKIISTNTDITDSYNQNLNYFENLKNALNDLDGSIQNDFKLPFIGGAIGYFGYDLGRQLEQIPTIANKDRTLTEAIAGIYSWAIICDHHNHRSLLVAHPRTSRSLLNDIRSRLTDRQPQQSTPFKLHRSFQSDISQQQYRTAFEQVQDYILAGDCYQINLAQRFSSTFSGDPWAAYLKLRPVTAAPFSAYLQFNDQAILSMSPERFLQSDRSTVSTAPIKGTIARGSNAEQDHALAQQLLNSEKDRAENLMIVDLLRNDLGKACLPGSIKVDELFELQSFETVHHLVSTISGTLKPDTHPLDLLASSFPGGSITGAPKIRAMQIIEELEPSRRSAYCGSIGYISCDGHMDTNIAIRTLVCENDTIDCWAGGGIVADSQWQSEYQECLTKIGKLLAALEE